MEILDSIINLLSDGKPHLITEIAAQKEVKVSMNTLMNILNVMEEFDFLELLQEEENGLILTEAKLTDPLLAFMRKIKWIEKAETYNI